MSPWFGETLRFARRAMDAVEAHARAAHPRECCGLMTGPADAPARVTDALPLDNVADRYHAHDPVAFPRTARTAWRMHDLARLDAFARGHREGAPVKVLYHSHCDAPAVPSDEDRAGALAGDEPVREVLWLVLSARADAVVDRRLWAWDAAAARFVEAPFTLDARP